MMGIIWDYDIMGLLVSSVPSWGVAVGHMGNNNITQPSLSLPGIASIDAGRDCSLLQVSVECRALRVDMCFECPILPEQSIKLRSPAHRSL